MEKRRKKASATAPTPRYCQPVSVTASESSPNMWRVLSQRQAIRAALPAVLAVFAVP